MSPFTAPPTGTPPGRIEKPSTVVILSIVTLSIYFYVWLWRVSGEVDAWLKKPGWTRQLALAAIVIAILSAISAIVTAVLVVIPSFSAARAGGTYTPPAWINWLGVIGLVGQLVAIACLRRVWTALANDASSRGRAPVQPSRLVMMSSVAPAGAIVSLLVGASGALGASSIGSIVSFVGLVLWAVVLAQSQKALNEAWESAATSAPASSW